MKKISLLINSALLSSTIALASFPIHAQLPTSVDGQMMPSLAPMLEKVTPAVVLISVKGTHEVKQQRIPDAFRFFYGNPRQQQPREKEFRGLGSGVIVNAEEGYIITNNHVIAEADEILITLKDGRKLEAKKLGADAESDIALLQVKAENLTEVKISDSDTLRVGDFTVAIGSPFGLGQTVTSGIVSALGRSGLNIENYEDFIQTDAAINSGNSGGALVNLRGELIGINTAIIGPNGGNVGIGFAIPSNMARNLVEQLIEFGEIKRGVLGVSGRSVNSDIAKALELDTNHGGFVEQVMPDSAAEKAGINAGDVIIEVNKKVIKSFSELRAKIGSLGAGKTIEITLITRDGDKKTVEVTLQKSSEASVEASAIHPMFEGASIENLPNNDGVLIKDIAKGSPAAHIGLKSGDIVNGINRQSLSNIAELRDYLKDHQGVLALNIIRGHTNLYLMIR